jgi:hypothetical protein
MHSDRSGNAAGSGYLITAPVPFFAAQIAGIGVSTAWVLIAAGEIETIAAGRRRLVVIESWRNYVARKLAAPPEDARRNNRVRPPARLGETRGGARGFRQSDEYRQDKITARGSRRRAAASNRTIF